MKNKLKNSKTNLLKRLLVKNKACSRKNDNNKKNSIKKAKGENKWKYYIPYESHDLILLVGEGNFSFSRALVRLFQGDGSLLTATCHDSKKDLEVKYPDACEIISDLQDSNVTVLYQVDGTSLEKSLPRNMKFDKIVFNFPHVGMGIKDQIRNIRANQELLAGFLRSSLLFLRDSGEIHITLKKGEPYHQWRLPYIAKSMGRLRLKTAIEFNPHNYPGYEHRRTLGFREDLSSETNEDISKNGSQTYIFVLSEEHRFDEEIC